jgi:hypothetical protein
LKSGNKLHPKYLTKISFPPHQNHSSPTLPAGPLRPKTTPMGTKPITALHREHLEWLKSLEFYSDEIRVLRHRIEEVSLQSSSTEFRLRIEHFQNQLIIYKHKVDELRHDISAHERFLVNNISSNPVASDHRRLNDDPGTRERMEIFEKLFREMRRELYGFLSQIM